MQFKTLSHKLVARICAYCRENNLLPPGQVRTTKLVYLVEYNYYGWEQKRLTDLDWVFWRYGPWSKTLSSVLTQDFHTPQENEIEPGKFRPVHWTPPQFDRPRLKFDNVALEGIIPTVLDRFAAMPYNELLDYVYFETAPMKDAVKGQPLDFSGILKPQRFVDPVSLLPPKVFHKLRKQFAQLEASKLSERVTDGATDQELVELLSAMDKEGDFDLPKGRVLIDDRVKAELREYFRG